MKDILATGFIPITKPVSDRGAILKDIAVKCNV